MVGKYMFKVRNKNTRQMCYPSWNLLVQSLMSEQNLKLTMKTLERRHVGLTIKGLTIQTKD